MRPVFVLAAAVLTLTQPLYAADALSEARRLYNSGQYDAAERAAHDAARTPATAEGARVVLGRIQLERYRLAEAPDVLETGLLTGLSSGIATLRAVDPRGFDARDRTELTIGLAEGLYLEDRFGAAGALFESIIDASAPLGPVAHERVLDWWATSLDRQAQASSSGATAERGRIYERILTRMSSEIAKDPGSTPAGYWLAAAARGAGDLERAWGEANASWVRAMLSRDRGVTLRADLDRLVVKALIPERAARLPIRDHAQAITGMLGEWNAFKARWGS